MNARANHLLRNQGLLQNELPLLVFLILLERNFVPLQSDLQLERTQSAVSTAMESMPDSLGWPREEARHNNARQSWKLKDGGILPKIVSCIRFAQLAGLRQSTFLSPVKSRNPNSTCSNPPGGPPSQVLVAVDAVDDTDGVHTGRHDLHIRTREQHVRTARSV